MRELERLQRGEPKARTRLNHLCRKSRGYGLWERDSHRMGDSVHHDFHSGGRVSWQCPRDGHSVEEEPKPDTSGRLHFQFGSCRLRVWELDNRAEHSHVLWSESTLQLRFLLLMCLPHADCLLHSSHVPYHVDGGVALSSYHKPVAIQKHCQARPKSGGHVGAVQLALSGDNNSAIIYSGPANSGVRRDLANRAPQKSLHCLTGGPTVRFATPNHGWMLHQDGVVPVALEDAAR